MAIDFVAEHSGIDFQEEAPSRSLTDFIQEPAAVTTETSPVTSGVLPSAATSTISPTPQSLTETALATEIPGELGQPATVPRFGAPGTVTRGASDTLSGLVEWALNKPEEALATLTPLAPAIAARYAPEIAKQFGVDLVAGVRGDKEALGRALTMGALIAGPKVFAKARESALVNGESTVAPERPVDVAAQLQQPPTSNLTPRDLRYLATTREPTINEPPRVESVTPPPTPSEVVTPAFVRTEERPGATSRPPVGIDITNEQGVRFGPEFWDFQPTEQAKRDAPLTSEAVVKSGMALREHTTEVMREAARSEVAPVETTSSTPPPPESEVSKAGGTEAPPAEPTPAIIGMGGATPSEFTSPPATTSIKNATVDQERAARGLPSADQPARRAFGAVWDDAMTRIDADPTVQDKLIASLRDNPRAATDTENALLLHRQVDLQNEYGKAARDLAQAVDDGRVEDAAFQQSRVADLSDRLLDLYNIGKKVGTEQGRGLNARKMLANQDFTLANMVTERRAANKGKKLSPRQEADTTRAQREIATAIKNANERPSVQTEFALDNAKKKWASQLADDAEANAPAPTRLLMRARNALNDIRTIVTSFDLSALLRQGKLVLAAHPVTWAKAIAPSIRAAMSPLRAFQIDHEISQRPNAPLYARAGLYLAEAGHKLTGQEEAYLTRGIARRIPGVGASERAYTTFLNKIRADLFDSFVKTLSRDGKTVTLPEAKVIANYINVATGRGDLAKFNAAANPMATIFFAPRFVASRFQYLLGQPLYYGALSGKVGWREGSRARQLVAGEYARALTGLALLYGTYAIAFDQQNADPYSSDFGKLRSNNTRLDPWAGLQQATVFMAREAGGAKTTLKGKTLPIRGSKVPYGGSTAVDVGTQFLRGKLAPVPGAIVDSLQGKNIVGEPVTPGSIALDLTVPITYQDVLSTLEDQGIPRATALTLLSILGEGVNTYSTAPRHRTK